MEIRFGIDMLLGKGPLEPKYFYNPGEWNVNERTTPAGWWPRVPKGFARHGTVCGEVSGIVPYHIETDEGNPNQYR